MAEMTQGPLCEVLYAGGLSDICRHDKPFSSEPFDDCAGFLQCLLGPGGKEQVRAFPRKGNGDLAADAPTRSGNDDYTVFEYKLLSLLSVSSRSSGAHYPAVLRPLRSYPG